MNGDSSGKFELHSYSFHCSMLETGNQGGNHLTQMYPENGHYNNLCVCVLVH